MPVEGQSSSQGDRIDSNSAAMAFGASNQNSNFDSGDDRQKTNLPDVSLSLFDSQAVFSEVFKGPASANRGSEMLVAQAGGDSQARDSSKGAEGGAKPSSSFSPEQLKQILSMRDRAMQLHKENAQAERDGRIPGIRRPDAPGADDVIRPLDKVDKYKFETFEANEAFEAARKSGRPIVVKVGYPGCGACRQMSRNSWPSVEQDLKENAIFLDVNINQDSSAPGRYGTRSYPTVIVFDPSNPSNPRELSRDQYMGASELKNFLHDAFKKHQPTVNPSPERR